MHLKSIGERVGATFYKHASNAAHVLSRICPQDLPYRVTNVGNTSFTCSFAGDEMHAYFYSFTEWE